jgi:type IV pilus assembly protein PilA
MKFLKNNKGFTLSELLIVMAVVVVLAAAAIPTVGSQIEAARESNDLAAIASAYVEAYTKASVKQVSGGTVGAETVEITVSQTKSGWDGLSNASVGGKAVSSTLAKTSSNSTGVVTFTFALGSDDDITLSSVSAAMKTAP